MKISKDKIEKLLDDFKKELDTFVLFGYELYKLKDDGDIEAVPPEQVIDILNSECRIAVVLSEKWKKGIKS